MTTMETNRLVVDYLRRLDPPEEIVEAEVPRQPARRIGALEIAALIALVLPVLSWLVGIVLVLVSRAWSSRDKLVGIPEAASDGDGVGPVEVLVLIFGFLLAGLPSVVFLGWRLRRSPTAA